MDNENIKQELLHKLDEVEIQLSFMAKALKGISGSGSENKALTESDCIGLDIIFRRLSEDVTECWNLVDDNLKETPEATPSSTTSGANR